MGNKYGFLGPIPKGPQFPFDRNINEPLIDNTQSEIEHTIDMKFEDYIDKLELKESKIKLINERRENIETILGEELDITDEHIFGSYSRGTMIESENGNDIDIMFILDENKHKDWLTQINGPKNCLLAIKNILEKNQKIRANVSIDQNVVTIKYKEFNIDIAPAFKDPSGGYRIPNTYGDQSWMRTNPRMYKRIIEILDTKTNGRYSDLVKIARGWNENNGKPLRSFHIENMVYNHIKNISPDNAQPLNRSVTEFFSRLPWYIQNPSHEPVYGEQIDNYLSSTQRDKAIKKANLALNKMVDGSELSNSGSLSKGIQKLKKIFGSKFN